MCPPRDIRVQVYAAETFVPYRLYISEVSNESMCVGSTHHPAVFECLQVYAAEATNVVHRPSFQVSFNS